MRTYNKDSIAPATSCSGRNFLLHWTKLPADWIKKGGPIEFHDGAVSKREFRRCIDRHAEWRKNSIKKQKNRRADKNRRRRQRSSKYVYRKFESISLHFFLLSSFERAARRLCLCNLIRVYFLLIELYSLFHPPRSPHLPQKGFQLHLRDGVRGARRRGRRAARRRAARRRPSPRTPRTWNVLRAPYLSQRGGRYNNTAHASQYKHQHTKRRPFFLVVGKVGPSDIIIYKIQPRSFYKLVRVSDSMRPKVRHPALHAVPIAGRTHCLFPPPRPHPPDIRKTPSLWLL